MNAVFAAGLVEGDDVLEPRADAEAFNGLVEQFDEAAVPELEPELGVEGRDPLRQVLERVAHDLVPAGDGAGRLVDELARLARGEGAARGDSCNDDAGRGRSENAGKKAFRHLQGILAANDEISGEGRGGAGLADETGGEMAELGESGRFGGRRRRIAREAEID